MSAGLSVWLWGPHIWDFLHFMGACIDSTNSFDAILVDRFLRELQPLLPCKFCRDSYGVFLHEVEQSRGTIQYCVRLRTMSAFLYELHGKVNSKLSGQRWDELIKLIKNNIYLESVQTLLDSSVIRHAAIECINKEPTLSIVNRRSLIMNREPFSKEGVLLIAYAMQERGGDISSFIQMLQQVLLTIDSEDAQFLVMLLQQEKDLIEVLYQQSKSSMSRADFMKETTDKLQTLVSSACGAGTCK